MNTNLKGYVAAVFSAICYGMNPLGALSLYKMGFNPDSALFFRFAVAAILLAIAVVVRKESFRLSRKELIYLVALGFVFGLSSLTYYGSFVFMDAGIASTLLFVYPVMVAVIMAVFFHEKLTYPMMFSIVIALLGVCVLYYGAEISLSVMGVALVLISALSYALYLVIVNRANLNVSAFKLTFYSSFFCAVVVLLHSLTTKQAHLIWPTTMGAWGYILILAIFPGLLSLVLMAVAVKHIGSTKTAIFGALEPVTAICIGVFVFGEVLTQRIIFGIFLILVAVTLIVVTNKKKVVTHK